MATTRPEHAQPRFAPHEGAPARIGVGAQGAGRPQRKASRDAKKDLLVFALIGCIFTYVWRAQDLFGIIAAVKLPILASLAAYGLYAIDSDRRRRLKTIRHPVTTCVIAILVLAVASVPTSLYKGLSFGFIKDDLGKTFLLMVILAASIRCLEDVRRYVAVMVIGGAIYALYVYLFFEVGPSGRLGSLHYYDANDLGMLLVCNIPLAVFFALRARSVLKRILSVLVIGLYVLVIIKTGSRGAFLGFVGVAAYVLVAFRTIPARVRAFAVAAGFGLLLVAAGDGYWEMMRTILNPTEDYNWSGNSESGRMEIWKRGVGYMLSRPLTGVGVQAFPVAEGTLSPLAGRQELGLGLKWSAAHNSFVQIGAELGVFGLVALVLLLFHAYRTATRIDPGQRSSRTPSEAAMLGHALGGSIIGYVICGFFLSQAYAAYMFVTYALIVGLHKVAAVRPVPGEARLRGGVGAASSPVRPRTMLPAVPGSR